LRILAISHLFPTLSERRYGIFVARQLAAMAALAAEITVIVPRVWCPSWLRRFERYKGYGPGVPLCAYEGLETVPVSYLRPPGAWYNRWAGLAAYRSLRSLALRHHRRRPFDVIYATDFFPDGDAAARLARDLRIPATCLGIGFDVNSTARLNRRMWRHFERTARALDGTLACGRSVAAGLEEVTGRKVLCVYGVIDMVQYCPVPDNRPFRRELHLPCEATVLLYAGYLDARKGIFELLNAFGNLARERSDVYLAMCGHGAQESALREGIALQGLTERVLLAGNVDPDEMHKWMKAADLFVLASHTEGMPNVVMEAMACGLPVVATAVGGLPEAVGDCPGAILVPPRDVAALEAAIRKVVAADKEARRSMGAASRRRAEERFDVRLNARRILDYLAQVVERRAAACR